MDTKDILVIIAPVVVAFGVSFYNYHTGRKSRREDAAFKFKEERYAKILDKLYSAYVAESRSAEAKESFLSEFYEAWIYASDEVIINMNKFQELFTKYQPDVSSDKAQPAIGEIVLAMRKDLRQKTSLHNDAFVYWNILP